MVVVEVTLVDDHHITTRNRLVTPLLYFDRISTECESNKVSMVTMNVSPLRPADAQTPRPGHIDGHESFKVIAEDDEYKSYPLGTPNDVRMFPLKRTASQSIPIANIERTPSEIQRDEDEAIAQYRELVMYQRIVCRVDEKQRATKRTHESPFMDRRPSDYAHCMQDPVRGVDVYALTGSPSFGYVVPMPVADRDADPETTVTFQDDRDEGVFDFEL